MKIEIHLVISTILFGAYVVSGARIKSQPSLYNRTDGIHSLTTQTFDQIYGKSNAFLIVFYADWCGHCKSFAPKYKQLARDIVLWKEVIQLAAVNCADPKNLPLCRDQQVLSYPYVKYFEPVISKGDVGQEFDVGDTRVESMRDSLIRVLVETSLKQEEIKEISSTSNWPDLRSINATSKQDLLQKIVHTMTKPVLAVIAPFDSLLGIQVILDLSSYRNSITVYKITSSFNRNLVLDFGIQEKQLPALVQLKPNPQILESLPQIQDVQSSRKTMVDHVANKFLKDVWVPVEEVVVVPTVAPENILNDTFEAKADPVHMIDLYNAIRYSLYHEVLTHQVLNETQIDALHNYFKVLHKYFPFDNENPRRFIKRMNQWMGMRKNDTNTMSIEAIMRAGSEGFLPPLQSYIACKGSSPELRGYPCALWQLFHTLTISEYTRPRTNDSQNQHLVLPAMKGYVANFFTCKSCRDHFTFMTANLENELRAANSSVLWLWKAHNAVNSRLAGSSTEDPLSPKIQFPGKSTCRSCHGRQEDEWEEKEVLKFLQNHYHSANLVRNSCAMNLASYSLAIFLTFLATTLVSFEH